MDAIYDPVYDLTPRLLSLIETISGLKGQFEASIGLLTQPENIFLAAQIDSVHYSTKLEGNALTRDQVTDILSRKSRLKTSRDLKEVVNYARARRKLFGQASEGAELTLELMNKTHEELLSGIVGGKLKGHFRAAQNAILDAKSRKIVYMPPEAQDVRRQMVSLVSWLRHATRDGISALLVAPVFHYRFVTIHPYMDGNGRAARLLTNFLLLSRGHDVLRYAALEKQHEINRISYYRNLNFLQGQNFYDIPENINITSWIEYCLSCLEAVYREALTRVTNRPLISPNENLFNDSPRLKQAVSLFHKYRTLTASDYQSLMAIGRTQAVHDLNALIKMKVVQARGGGRSRKYQCL